MSGQPWNIEFDKFENVEDPGTLSRGIVRARRPLPGASMIANLRRRAVRRHRLRQPAVPHQRRPVGDDGPDELRQPRARRVRDARRLRVRGADVARWACRSSRRCRSRSWSRRWPASCSSARSTGACTRRRHLDQVLFSHRPRRSCRSRRRPTSSGRRSSRCACRISCAARCSVLGLDLGAYRLFLIARGRRDHGRAAAAGRRARASARRCARRSTTAAPRRGSASTSIACSALTFALGSGLAGLGGGARHRRARARSDVPAQVHGVLPAGRGGRRRRHDQGRLVAALILGIFDVAGKYYVPQVGAFVIYVADGACC